MFRNYVTPEQIYDAFPRLKDWIQREHLSTVINSSALSVADDLRKRNINVSQIYVPLHIDTTGLAIGNERRIVFDVSDAGSGLSFTIYGSDNNTDWNIIKLVDGTDAVVDISETGRSSIRLSELYAHIKYDATGTGTYTVYAVDVAFDQLIILKALINICLPILGSSEDAKAMYDQATLQYDVAVANTKYDYDRDESGSIEYTERNVQRMVRMLR